MGAKGRSPFAMGSKNPDENDIVSRIGPLKGGGGDSNGAYQHRNGGLARDPVAHDDRMCPKTIAHC